MKILAINDNGFPLAELLGLRGYLVDVSYDIHVGDVEDYDIVICDWNGVGATFGEPGDYIRTIRTEYPDKKLILYTASFENSQYVDVTLRMGTDCSEWIEALQPLLQNN